MNSPICITNRKQATSLSVAGAMLAIAPLWLMLAAAPNPAQAQSSGTSAADWTEFHRDNMQRWNPDETTLGVSNAADLLLKWQLGAGGTSPAVANGVMYLSSYDEVTYAINPSNGNLLWGFNPGSGPGTSSPAVANGVVYLTGFGLFAVNSSTGTKLWSYGNGFPFGSSPTVVNGVVYVGCDDDNVYAVNASTGAKLWSFKTGDLVRSSPAVVNGVVYVLSLDDNLYALNANTGAKLWSDAVGVLNPAAAPSVSSPAVANGVVYVGSGDGSLYALNAATGSKLWSYPTGGSMTSSPALANGVVYFGSFDGNVYALNATTGAKLWSYATQGRVAASPAAANGVVYIGSEDGTLYALNASTGAVLWSYAAGATAQPVIVDGVVYVGSTTGIFAFASGGSADIYLRILPTPTTVHQGDLLTYAFPVWDLGPGIASHEVLTTQVPEGTTFDYIRISGTPGLGTCTTPPYQGTGEIVCHENSAMAVNTTWTVRLVVKVTAPAGTVIKESATATEDTADPNTANNTATVSMTVQ